MLKCCYTTMSFLSFDNCGPIKYCGIPLFNCGNAAHPENRL